MSDQATNGNGRPLIYDESKPTAQIRQEAIAALEAGYDYVLIVAMPREDGTHDINTHTSLGLGDVRQCVDIVHNDLQYVRPGMSN